MSQSYTPLYRKYRPQSFGDLVGQEVVVKALSNAIELDKISHAYLFCGSRGTGKTSAARILAKSLNCLEGPTVTPCGVCANCVSVTNGNAIDVTEIDAASNNSVEDARDILEKVQFVPVSGKFKIFIIDEVHMLSNSAFNTLLKTLEEPPENLVFILATTEPHKILDTIISRCQRFDFRKIKIDDIQNRLKYIAKEENINISNDAIELISQKSTGGLRDAIALLDQASVLGLAGNEISTNDILAISGAISQDNLYSLTESLAKKEPEKLIELINTITNQGNEPILVLSELVSYFRNLLIVKNGGSSEQINNLLGISEQFIPKIKEQSEFFETIEIAQIIEKMAEYEVMLKNTTNTMMWLEVALISILHRQDIKVIKDLETRVSNLEAAISGGSVKAPTIPKPKIEPAAQAQTLQPQPLQQEAPKEIPKEVSKTEPTYKPVEPQTPAAKPAPVSEPIQNTAPPKEDIQEASQTSGNGDLKQEWVNILNNMNSIPAKMFFMQSATPRQISKDSIVLSFRNEVLLKGAKDGNKASQLEEAIKKVYGATPKIDLITADAVQEVKKKPSEPKVEATVDTKIEIESAPKPSPKKIEEAPIKKEKAFQIEQNIDESLDVLEEVTKEIKAEIPNPHNNYSDDTKMVIDLFQGKTID